MDVVVDFAWDPDPPLADAASSSREGSRVAFDRSPTHAMLGVFRI